MAIYDRVMIRGEPEYIDQVPRREAYEKSHPNVEIIYLGPCWQAIIREDDGQTIFTRSDLRRLLDKLQSLDTAAENVASIHEDDE